MEIKLNIESEALSSFGIGHTLYLQYEMFIQP